MKRINSHCILVVLICCFIIILPAAQGQHKLLFAGTYTSGESKGIYSLLFNSATGELKVVSVTDSVDNPSYLALAPNGSRLYAVNENGGDKGGGISSFSVDRNSGKLVFLNQQVTGGDHPCYVAVDASGRWVVVGNYSGGNLAVFPVGKGGEVLPLVQLVQHEGKSVNTQRQEKAHVHAVKFTPDHKYVAVPDLGMDKVLIYEFSSRSAKPLIATPAFSVSAKAGNGPRHITFHPSRPYAYVVEELSGTVSVYRVRNEQLILVQTISTHPDDYTGEVSSADIHISPDGKYLYASNRGGSNTIAIFSINPSVGMLKMKGIVEARGKTPRNFTIDPTGNFLLVANQNSNNVVVFRRNKQTGMLTATGNSVSLPSPVCLVWGK